MNIISQNVAHTSQQHVPTGNTLFLSIARGTECIPTSSIIRVEAISNYSKLFFSNGKTLVVAKILSWFEEQLYASGFVRIHRKHLINKTFIRRYIRGTGGQIELLSGEQIDVAKRKKTCFLKYWHIQAA